MAYFLPLLKYYMLIKISFSDHCKSGVDSQCLGPEGLLQSPHSKLHRVPAESTTRDGCSKYSEGETLSRPSICGPSGAGYTTAEGIGMDYY